MSLYPEPLGYSSCSFLRKLFLKHPVSASTQQSSGLRHGVVIGLLFNDNISCSDRTASDDSIIILLKPSLAVTLRSTWFSIEGFYIALTLRLCVLYGSQIKQQRLPHTSLSVWFL
jgi:hypothetical protein